MEKPNLYSIRLTPQEVSAHFDRALSTLEAARENPWGKGLVTPHIRKLRMHMDPQVKHALTESIGVLLPLSHQPVVQEATREQRQGEITVSDAGQLLEEIMLFQSSFRNTGVSVLDWESGGL